MKRAKLLWMDLEMTGLEPGKDRILEVAAIATGWDFEVLGKMTGVVKVPEVLIKQRMVGEFWEKNAETREALVSQNSTGKRVDKIEDEILQFLDKVAGKDAVVILAGNSIHQDRKFIDREWPRLAKRLHYRMLDVSAWKVVFEGKFGKKFIKREMHRAMDDILGSIEELKWYLTFMK